MRLLKDTLEAWKAEVEKKPPTMSITDAYEALELPTGVGRYVRCSVTCVLQISVK